MRFTIAVAVACLSVLGVSRADTVQASIKKHTEIPAQALGTALQALAKDREFQIVCRADLVADIRSDGISGEFTAGELGQPDADLKPDELNPLGVQGGRGPLDQEGEGNRQNDELAELEADVDAREDLERRR